MSVSSGSTPKATTNLSNAISLATPSNDPDLPNYRAVSYTWDETLPLLRIKCRHSTRIRQNLLTLLKSIRHDDYDCWLWIDAICIDQTSDSEKSRQVKLMGRIYTMINSVLAWLGPDDDSHLHYACKFIYDTAHNFRGFSPSKKARDGASWQCNHDSLAEFLQLRYWSRKWIVQEVVLAR
ncbi:hypothetical protein K469DRAFT_576551, partial [Zopfia rhizophila CBS 207.26]